MNIKFHVFNDIKHNNTIYVIMNLYILKCKNNKYYVGTTTLDTTKRLAQHMSGRGSAWTRKYKPLWIEKEIKNCDKYDEDKWTKIYMDKHGINNVRGGSYSQVSLPSNAVNLLEREVNHANQKCLFCGKKGHFINQCPSKKSINPKYQSKNLYYLNMSCNYESADEISYESESDDEYTIEELEKVFKDTNKEEGRYTFDGETYIWHDEELWEESPHERVGARDGTIYSSEFEYIRPIKKKKANNCGKCNRCGRNSHHASKCYAKKHIKGHYLKN